MIEKKLDEINSLKSQILSLRTDKDWDDAFLEKVKVDFTYNSNKIEGVTLTYGQTIKLLRDFVTPQNAAPGELLDLINHQKVLDNVFKNYQTENFSVDNIKALHKELMKDLAQWTDDSLYGPGRYKLFENVTVRGNGKIHTYLLPAEVPNAMDELVNEINSRLANVDVLSVDRHPIVIATYFHQQFLNRIHPFNDGNGRIGRLFTNLIILKLGYPPIFIKEIDRKEYLECLKRQDYLFK